MCQKVLLQWDRNNTESIGPCMINFVEKLLTLDQVTRLKIVTIFRLEVCPISKMPLTNAGKRVKFHAILGVFSVNTSPRLTVQPICPDEFPVNM